MSPALPLSAPFSLPLTLPLRPSSVVTEYRAVQTWKTYVAGQQHLTTITKHVALGVQARGDQYGLDFKITAPQLVKQDDLQPLEQLALRLAALYEWVVVEASPTGQFLAVLNHEQLLGTWQTLRASLLATTASDDAVTGFLIAFLDRQLPDRAKVLQSLRQDYLYQALGSSLCARPLTEERAEGRVWEFPHFFPQQSLHFLEHLAEIGREAAGRVLLTFRGTVDADRTDVAGIGQLIAAAGAPEQGAGPSPAPPRPPAATPHFGYTATYELDLATGLPAAVVLDVHARLAEAYNKQYTLTLDRV